MAHLEAKLTRDPVAPAKRSEAADAKASAHVLPDGTPVHSFATLMADLATIVRNTCRSKDSEQLFTLATTPTQAQQSALAMLAKITL